MNFDSRIYSKTHWLITIIVTFLKLGTIFEFFFDRKRENLFSNRELAVNLFLCEAKVDDIKEALE